MVERRQGGEPVAYITGRRAFWNIELHVGPGVLVPRPDSEVLIASAIEHFEGGDGPSADPRSRHRAGNPAARRARRLAGRDGPRRRRLAPRFVLCRGQCPPARVRGPAQAGAGQLGRRPGREVRPDPVQPALYRRRRRARPGRCRISSPTKRCSPARKGSTPIAQLAPQLPRLLAPGGLAAVEIGARPGRGGHRASRPRRPASAGRRGPRRAAARTAVNLGVNEKSLGIGRSGHYIGSQDRACSLTKS